MCALQSIDNPCSLVLSFNHDYRNDTCDCVDFSPFIPARNMRLRWCKSFNFFPKNALLSFHRQRERDWLYHIIVQNYDVGLHSRREPMECDAGTGPFTAFDTPSPSHECYLCAICRLIDIVLLSHSSHIQSQEFSVINISVLLQHFNYTLVWCLILSLVCAVLHLMTFEWHRHLVLLPECACLFPSTSQLLFMFFHFRYRRQIKIS